MCGGTPCAVTAIHSHLVKQSPSLGNRSVHKVTTHTTQAARHLPAFPHHFSYHAVLTCG